MSKGDKMKMLFDLQLTDKETYFIGKIVAAWDSLEHEMFVQTLHTYPHCTSGLKTYVKKSVKNLYHPAGHLDLGDGLSIFHEGSRADLAS